MDPTILVNFNRLIYSSYGVNAPNSTRLHVYGNANSTLEQETHARINGDWAKYPLIAKLEKDDYATVDAWPGLADMRYTYQLQWFQ